MKYIDANIFLYAALDSGKKGEHARKILRGIVNEGTAAISTLTIDEVVWILWKETKQKEKAIEQGLKILELPNLRILSVDPEDVYTALNLMKKYEKLKPRDAIHLAVSLNSGIFTILSDDSDFDQVKEITRIKL